MEDISDMQSTVIFDFYEYYMKTKYICIFYVVSK